jgi:hypothetical protein
VTVGKDERRLRRSSTLAGVGDGVVAVALPLLAAGVTRDPLAVAAVVAAQHLPWAIVHVGWRYLRADRRTVVGLVDTGRAIALGLLAFLTLIGRETILDIQITAFAIGLGEALTDGVETETADVSALSSRGMVGLAVVGLPLGGLLYEVYPATPFVFDVLAFACAALFVLLMKREVGPPPEALVDDAEPVPIVAGTRRITVAAAVAAAAGSAVLGVLVLFALDDLGLGAPAFGVLLAGLALCAAAGAFVAPEVGAAFGVKPGMVLALVVAGAGHAAASQVADARRPWIAAIALGIATGAAMIAAVLSRALLQRSAGRPLNGGALQHFHLAVWSAIPAGALAGGWIASQRSVHEVLLWAAGAWAVAAVVGVASPAVEKTAEMV